VKWRGDPSIWEPKQYTCHLYTLGLGPDITTGLKQVSAVVLRRSREAQDGTGQASIVPCETDQMVQRRLKENSVSTLFRGLGRYCLEKLHHFCHTLVR
jgi:hypothetical protein